MQLHTSNFQHSTKLAKACWYAWLIAQGLSISAANKFRMRIGDPRAAALPAD